LYYDSFMPTATTVTSFPIRLIGALALDPAIYEEVEADPRATGQAFLVVLMSSVSAGIGAFGWGDGSVRRILFISSLALMSWAAWALLTFAIGTKVMPDPQTRSNVGELLRTIGFASAPGILRVFGIVPGATIPAFAITAIWMLCAMVVAVRQALDFTSTARAIAVCAIGWALAILIAVSFGLFLSSPVS
jgi:hypothetical protein